MSSDGNGEAKPAGGAAAASVKLWIGLVLLLLGVPAAIYAAVQNWGLLFPAGPTIEFAECSQKNFQVTIFNRRQSRATIRELNFELETGGKLVPVMMNATLDDPLAGARGIGPKGDKELPYPNEVDAYFTAGESAANCKVHVTALLQYENQKKLTKASGSCDCQFKPE
jgi:hypothetical protein